MKRLVMIGSAIAALAWGSVAAYASTATITTVSPWAYACGHTTFGNPATKADTPDENGCPADRHGRDGNGGPGDWHAHAEQALR